MDTGPTPGSVEMAAADGRPRVGGAVRDWWQRVPVFHAIGPGRTLGYPMTLCGWPITLPGIPLAHLTRVCRPCRHCWDV
jgi:hypothetical protein